MRLRAASPRVASGAAWPSTQRRSALPCLLMCPSRYLSADALTVGRQPDVADHVLTAGEPPHGAEHQHGGEGGHGTDAGMSHEAAGVGIGGRRGGHVEIKLVDMAVQPVQQLETVIPAAARVRQEHERLQLGQALARPQRGARASR